MSDQKLANRLKEARELAGFETGSDAARALGVPIGSYNCHENGTRGFKRDRALKYAKAFKVDPQWLLYGLGNPRGPDIIDKIKALNEDNQRFVLKQIDTLLAQQQDERRR
jgi:transcriptional regulator with XRE-family HTH domain